MEIKIDKSFTFNKNDIIVVGCSSGPDSMALVNMLLKIRKKYNLMIVIAHVNHNVRQQSIEEAMYIKQYCIDNDLMFETMTIEEYGDDNFENEARNIRYHFFKNLIEKYKANYLMTAHHADDLMETILMRISRGSNLAGYSGFHKIIDMGDYKIVRPLIEYTKDELERYDIENNIKYFIDESNFSDKYTRNRYRKYILPFLKSEDKYIHKKFLKFSENLIDANRFVERERNRVLKDVLYDKKIDINQFISIDPFLQKEILYYLMYEFYQDDLILINDKHIKLISDLIYSNKVNGFINLPNEVIATKSYNYVELKRNTEEMLSYEIEFNQYAKLPNNHSIELISNTTDNSNNVCRLNSKEIKLPLIIRTRKYGDRMYIKGMNGSRKIKDIFIDKKIKLSERENWPIVVDSVGRVVWLPGLKKSKFDKQKDESYDIIMRYR